MINCGHCHGGHATVADVRACATSSVLVMDRPKFPEVPWHDMRTPVEKNWAEQIAEAERLEELGEFDAAIQERERAEDTARDARKWSLQDLSDEVTELLRERVMSTRERRSITDYLSGRTVTEFGLKTQVARLRVMPKKDAGDPVTQEGMYRLDGVVYRVQANKDKTGLYAKRAVQEGGEWKLRYEPGAIRKLSAGDRMDLGQVEEFGRATSWCGVCGLKLTNPKSVERGIGPICAGKV